MGGDFSFEHGLVHNLHGSYVKLNLSFIPSEEDVVFTILNVVNTLDNLVVKFMSPNVGETISNKFKSCRAASV